MHGCANTELVTDITTAAVNAAVNTQVHALLLVEEEEKCALAKEVAARGAQLEGMARKTGYLLDRVSCEEDAKRRTLLRYTHILNILNTSMYTSSIHSVSCTRRFGITQW
jgi:hypothetical protein